MERTIEKQVADVILENPIEMKIGRKTYQVAPPSAATLILASEAVSRLPRVQVDPEKIVEETFAIAKDCRTIGEIAAILILGAKHITETIKVSQIKEKRYLWGLIRFRRTVEVTQTVNRKDELTKELLEELTPKELNTAVSDLLSQMQIADFFGITTFLTEINLLHPKKVVN